MNIRIFFVILVAVTSVTTFCFATTPWNHQQRVVSETEKRIVSELDHAFGFCGGGLDEISGCASFESIMLHGDDREKEYAIEYLARNHKWLDLEPCRTIIEESLNAVQSEAVRFRLALLDLHVSTRQEKIGKYLRIIEGEENELSLEIFIFFASKAGLREIKEPMMETWDRLRSPNDFGTRTYLELNFDLRYTENPEDDPVSAGVRRLAAMKADEFRDRMSEDREFRKVVSEIAREACGAHPIDGSLLPGCALFPEILDRQVELIPEGLPKRISGLDDNMLSLAGRTLPMFRPKNDPQKSGRCGDGENAGDSHHLDE